MKGSPCIMSIGKQNHAFLDGSFYQEFSIYSKHKKQPNSNQSTEEEALLALVESQSLHPVVGEDSKMNEMA